MNANTDNFISIKGSGWVFQVLKEWICYGRRTIGKALVEVGQMRGTRYLLPLGNHRPDLTAYSLFGAFIKPVPYRLECGLGLVGKVRTVIGFLSDQIVVINRKIAILGIVKIWW